MVDSRSGREGREIRRRRECLDCRRRFTTYERLEGMTLLVVKKDGSRIPFDRQKVLAGMARACEKRPVAIEQLNEVVDRIEQKLQDLPEQEIAAHAVGEMVMEALQQLDQVAYVRFASVYREFKDVNAFMEEIESLLRSGRPGAG